uniref:Zgc:162613 n=1 Tax=Oryzias latipes TaxID=8090 RepID=A0A3P9M6M8_ORYLA
METNVDGIVATERYGSAESWKYVVQDGVMQRRKDGSSSFSLVGAFKSVFLPQGYPESVSEDYLQYQFWDTLQAFASTLSWTLVTQASLKGVGVGNQDATVAAATVTWILRDGTGMFGRILFAWQKGSRLDSEAKKWRLFADVLNDIAMFIEILAPFFPSFFTLIVCTAGVFKAIVGVAGGATRAADLNVFSSKHELWSPFKYQIFLHSFLASPFRLSLGLFFLFTILHLFANYKAVRSVVMETFNQARLSIVLQQYLKDKRILSPFEANQREPVFLEFKITTPIKLGVKLQDVVQSPEDFHLALRNNSMPYLLGVRNGCICVCLGSGASVHDEIRAACQALWLSNMLKSPSFSQTNKQKVIDANFHTFLKGVEAAGWDTKRTLLNWDEWRAEWKRKSS